MVTTGSRQAWSDVWKEDYDCQQHHRVGIFSDVKQWEDDDVRLGQMSENRMVSERAGEGGCLTGNDGTQADSTATILYLLIIQLTLSYILSTNLFEKSNVFKTVLEQFEKVMIMIQIVYYIHYSIVKKNYDSLIFSLKISYSYVLYHFFTRWGGFLL